MFVCIPMIIIGVRLFSSQAITRINLCSFNEDDTVKRQLLMISAAN